MKNYKALLRSGKISYLSHQESSRDQTGGMWLRVLRAGICGTDLQILGGVRRDLAQVLGHEGVGEIWPCQTHSEVEAAIGDYMIFNPVDRNNQDKILGHSYDGVFAEAVYVNSDCVVYADPRLPADLAPLVEPLATAMYAWKLISMRRDLLNVGIWGGGSAAILMALVATLNGAQACIFHHRPERLLWLSRRGFPPSIKFYNTRAASFTSSFRARLDAGIICVPRDGAMLALGQALDLVRKDGCIDLFGGFALGDSSALLPGTDLGLIRRQNVCGEVHCDSMLSVSRRAIGRVWLTGHRGSSAEQLMASQQILLAHAPVFGSVISDVVSLERAASLIPNMIHKPGGYEFLKVIIDLTMTEPRRDLDLMLTLGRLDTAHESC